MNHYEKYKPSGVDWIGKIPGHWSLRRMKYEVNYQKGKNPKEQSFEEVGKPYLSMEYLRGNPKQIFYVEDFESYLNVKENEILLLWDGSNAGEFIKSKEGVLSSTTAVLNIHSNNPNYAWYYFKTFEIILREGTIGMGIPHVNGEDFKNQYFIIPPKDEQITIVNFLDEKTTQIDKLISKKQKLIELLKEERTAIINEAVSGKGKNWEIKKLKYVIKDFESGVSVNAADEPVDSIGEVGVLKTSCVYNYVFEPDENKRVLREEISRVSCAVRGNSIIMSRMNTPELVGASGFVEKDYPNLFLPDRLWQTVLQKNVLLNVKWLSYLFISNSFRQEMTSKATGTSSSMKNISKSDVLDIRFAFPTLKEQTVIVQHIQTETQRVDNTISKIEKEIELMNEYRTALISEVVTGKIKVA